MPAIAPLDSSAHPLAILRSELEAVQDGVREPTTKVITSLHDETLRLGRLIADLETLASADAAAFTLKTSAPVPVRPRPRHRRRPQ